MKTLGNQVGLRIGMGLVLFVTGLLAAGAANAQSALQGTFHLDQEVRWGKSVLGAGDYTVEIESRKTPVMAMVRSADGNQSFMVMAAIHDDSRSKKTALFLTRKQQEWVVLSLNVPQIGWSLVFDRAGEEESKELANAEEEKVPVTAVKK